MSHRIVQSTLMNITNTAIGFAVAYLMTPVILHRLGVEQYGLWAFLSIFAVTGYFSLLDFGFQGAAIKYVAEYHARSDRERLASTVSATIVFFFVIGVAGGLLLWAFNQTLLPQVFRLPADQLPTIQRLVDLIALSFVVQFPILGISAILEGLQRYDVLRGIGITITLLTNLAIFLWLPSVDGVSFLVLTTIAGGLLMAIGYAVATRILLPDLRFRLALRGTGVWRQLLTLSSKLFVSKIVGLIFNNTDKILIAILLTVSLQTDYDIVNKLHLILLSILSIMNQAVLPAASAAEAQGDRPRLRRLLLLGTKYSVALVVPMWIFLMLLPKQALTMWVGSSFVHLTPLLVLYASHIALTMLVGVSSTMLVGVDRVGQVLKISVWAAVINLLISATTARWLGIGGLILGTVVAYVGSSALYIAATNRLFDIRPRDFFASIFRPLAIPIVATLLAAFLLGQRFTAPSLLTGLLMLVGLYLLFTVGYLIRGISVDETTWIRQRWASLRTRPTNP